MVTRLRENPRGFPAQSYRSKRMALKPGLRVVRGPDWQWGDQDGGEGHVGTVVEVGQPSERDGGRAVVVQWDCGERCRYRCGVEGKYDLRVLDSAPAGINNWAYVQCDGCVSFGIAGFIWKCCSCHDCAICSACYFSDKHLVEHHFTRKDTAHSWCRVPPREGARKVACMGLFPGAKVKCYDKGFPQGFGLIEAIKDGTPSSPRNVAVVKWETTSSLSDCKVGHNGEVELMCIKPASNGFYYPDHLPVLGMQCVDKTKDIIAGDYIRVELDVEVFQMMQTDDHGGWRDGMSALQGKIGRVKCIQDSGDLVVTYNGLNGVVMLNSEAVAKVDIQEFEPNDMVQILDDKEKAMKLQRDFGILWLEEMNDTINHIGIVIGMDGNGNVAVRVNQKLYLYSPCCIELKKGCQRSDRNHEDSDSCELLAKVRQLLECSSPDVIGYAAQLEDDTYISEYLASYPNEVNRFVDGIAPIHYAAKCGKISTLKTLLDYHADVNITDDYSRTPLHFCCEYCPNKNSLEICQALLEAGADPNIKNVVGETPLIKAVTRVDTRAIVGLTNSQKTDVHIDDLEGQTPLHLAVSDCVEISVKILLSAGADSGRLNHKLESAVHLAANLGFAGGLKLMVEHHPECINLKDEDGCTPLHIAVLGNHFTSATVLMKQTCDIDAKTNLDRTPLHAAVVTGNTYLIEKLVGFGANMNIRDHEECTPLHILLLIDVTGETIDFQPISHKTPELQKVKQLLSNDDIDTRVVIACFLIQEGADMSQMGFLGLSSTQTLAISAAVNSQLMSIVKQFAEKYAGTGKFHGSLRKSNMSEEAAGNFSVDTDSVADACKLLLLASLHASSQGQHLCELCEEEPIDVRFLPCQHAVICSICAKRATKCIQCKKPITGKQHIT